MKRFPARLFFPIMLLFFAVSAMPDAGKSGDEFRPPEGLEPGWYARIETSMGRIIARLLPEQAPQAVAYFAAFAEGDQEWIDPLNGETVKGPFYDGVKVYKAVAGSRFEVGGRSGTGRGGPMMFIPREGLEGPVDFGGSGRLGMTSAAGARFSAYQFFVTYAAQPRMSGLYPCFGLVVSGQETVLDISQVKTYSNGRPIEPVTIEKIRIFAVGEPEPLPKPLPYKPAPEKPLRRRKLGAG